MTHTQHDSTISDTSLNGEHINQFTQSMPINMMAAAAQAHLPHLYNHSPTSNPTHFGGNNSNTTNNTNSNHSSPRVGHSQLATSGAATAPSASTPTTSTSHSLNATPLSTPPPSSSTAASLVGLHHLSHLPPTHQVPAPPAPTEEEPLYVNAKQYHRILKRRTARLRLEELNRIARSRKPYLHESRHKHAMRRPRGPGGRFLTSSEIAALEKQKEQQQDSTQQSQGVGQIHAEVKKE